MNPGIKTLLWPRFAAQALNEHLSRIPGVALKSVKTTDEFITELPTTRILVMPASLYSAEAAKAIREHGAGLQFLQLLTAGYDSLQARGVPPGVQVASAGDSWSPAVAEHAIALMLALVKQLPTAVAGQAQRVWDAARISPRMRTLRGKTLVIFGYGSIGREAAMRARGLGMRVIGVSRSARRDEFIDEACAAADFDQVLPAADVLLISAPSSDETRGLIDARRLALLKPTSLVVNIARGNIVDAAALRAALLAGQLGGAGLDVTDPEPLPADDPLWDTPNLILTPHVSGATGPDGDLRLAEHAAANVARFVSGQTPSHLINFQGLASAPNRRTAT